MCVMLYLQSTFEHICLQTDYFKWLSIIYKIHPGKKKKFKGSLLIKTLFVSLASSLTHIPTLSKTEMLPKPNIGCYFMLMHNCIFHVFCSK